MKTASIKTNRNPVSVPRVRRTADSPSNTGKGHSHFMMACCALMVLGVGVVFATAPSASSWLETLGLALPLLGCVGAHLIMHRFMGRSCQNHESKQESNGGSSDQNNSNIRKVN